MNGPPAAVVGGGPAPAPGHHDVMKRAFSRVAPPSTKPGRTHSRDVRKSRIERSRLAGWHVRCSYVD